MCITNLQILQKEIVIYSTSHLIQHISRTLAHILNFKKTQTEESITLKTLCNYHSQVTHIPFEKSCSLCVPRQIQAAVNFAFLFQKLQSTEK